MSRCSKFLLLIVTMFLFVGCQDKKTLSDQIINVIDNQCHSSDNCDISLNEITNFKWDKMVMFQAGSSKKEISKALGMEYNGSTDLISGLIFVLNNKIVYEEKLPYYPEKPSKLFISIERKPGDPSCVLLTLENSNIQGVKETIDGKTYYSVKAKIN